jgi:hypothetical protein
MTGPAELPRRHDHDRPVRRVPQQLCRIQAEPAYRTSVIPRTRLDARLGYGWVWLGRSGGFSMRISAMAMVLGVAAALPLVGCAAAKEAVAEVKAAEKAAGIKDPKDLEKGLKAVQEVTGAGKAEKHEAKAEAHEAKAEKHEAKAEAHEAKAEKHEAKAEKHEAKAEKQEAKAEEQKKKAEEEKKKAAAAKKH